MRDLDRFIRFVLPDAPTTRELNRAGFQANPGGLPEGAQEILDLVACRTGIPTDYLDRAVGLVLRGLAGLECLYFLHGLRGQISGAVSELDGADRERLDFTVKRAQEEANEKARAGKRVEYTYDWSAGTVTETTVTEYIPDPNFDPLEALTREVDPDAEVPLPPPKVRTIKLGKFLRQHSVSERLLHLFETRTPMTWQWRISAHPFDVLTMSFRRAWTSCMRPGEVAQYGPLTDMAAGAACLFWYRPGADEPAGRTLLRPVVRVVPGSDGEPLDCPRIAVAPTIYGSGPAVEMLGVMQAAILDALRAQQGPWADDVMSLTAEEDESPKVGFVFLEDLREAGINGRALTRGIYDDVSKQHGAQSNKAYDEAYARLATAPWPRGEFHAADIPAPTAKMIAGTTTLVLAPPTADEVAQAMHSTEALEAATLGGLFELHARVEENVSRYLNSYFNPQLAGVVDPKAVVARLKMSIEFVVINRLDQGPNVAVLIPLAPETTVVSMTAAWKAAFNTMSAVAGGDVPFVWWPAKEFLRLGNAVLELEPLESNGPLYYPMHILEERGWDLSKFFGVALVNNHNGDAKNLVRVLIPESDTAEEAAPYLASTLAPGEPVGIVLPPGAMTGFVWLELLLGAGRPR